MRIQGTQATNQNLIGTNILHLNLYFKWFNQILLGIKKEEYRIKKPYWEKRLKNRSYDEVWFRNGYGQDRPFIRVKCLGIREEKERFVIGLGEILETKNIKNEEHNS